MFQGLEATRMPKAAATGAFQYLTTFVREAGPDDADGLWGARASHFVLHATRPILLTELLESFRPTMPAHFGQLHHRNVDLLRVVMTVVHYALLGTLALQTDLQRRDPLGPYVPDSGFADLVPLPIQPMRPLAGETDTDESPSPNEGTSAASPTTTAASACRAAMVADLASMMQALAIGRSCDSNRMVALSTALQPGGAQPGAATTSTATSAAVP
eukprot:682796-Pleurochrysis_carterae.AAC.1